MTFILGVAVGWLLSTFVAFIQYKRSQKFIQNFIVEVQKRKLKELRGEARDDS